MSSNPIATARAELGVAVRFGNVEAAEAARQRLNAAKVEKTIRELNTASLITPALTADQRSHLAALLLDGGAA